MSLRRPATALPALLASGCVMMPAASPPPASPESTRSEPSSAGAETSPERPPGITPASVMLLEQSRAQRAAGSYAEAASSLERALRIEPDNPWLWLELGEVRLAEGDRGQAEEMARKALTLAGGDRALGAGAERLLARAQSL